MKKFKRKVSPIYGLRDVTTEEIKELKRKYPRGVHCTTYEDGTPLPYNGLFYSIRPKRLR